MFYWIIIIRGWTVIHILFNREIHCSICTSCLPGTYTNTTTAIKCSNCPAGSQSLAGASTCTPCPLGTSNSLAGGLCYKCYAGTFAGTVGLSKCTECPTGSSSAVGALSCNGTYCPLGYYYYPTFSQGDCAQCSSGTYTNTTGANKCSICPAGSSSPYRASSCTPCAAGTYSTTAGFTCEECLAGTYAGTAGSSKCIECPPGSTSSPGASSCYVGTPCQLGYYYPAGGSACLPCSAGTYSNRISSTDCKKCPKGESSLARATTANLAVQESTPLQRGLRAKNARLGHILLILYHPIAQNVLRDRHHHLVHRNAHSARPVTQDPTTL
jgi:hypothetical protein